MAAKKIYDVMSNAGVYLAMNFTVFVLDFGEVESTEE
jgi:hypothetical protein